MSDHEELGRVDAVVDTGVDTGVDTADGGESGSGGREVDRYRFHWCTRPMRNLAEVLPDTRTIWFAPRVPNPVPKKLLDEIEAGLTGGHAPFCRDRHPLICLTGGGDEPIVVTTDVG